MKNESPEIVVMITCPVDVAQELAGTLIESRLAACVNIIERVQSVYRWEGQVKHDSEALLIIKTVSSRFSELQSRALSVHPYSCPEIIATPIVAGFDKYLTWLRDETK
jgi:periplasmic divalent cation tolerance protein